MTTARTQLRHTWEREVAGEIEDVWRALTDPDEVQQYHEDAAVESSWMPGEPVRFLDEDGEVVVEGVVVDVDAPHRLVHTFAYSGAAPVDPAAAEDPPSRVTWTLEPGDEGTHVSLLHDGFEAATPTYRAVEDRWEQVLDGLVDLFEGAAEDR
jgi:uncharacterized protein YndB with AHSA1/START domain